MICQLEGAPAQKTRPQASSHLIHHPSKAQAGQTPWGQMI
jgi:hypothetical protein